MSGSEQPIPPHPWRGRRVYAVAVCLGLAFGLAVRLLAWYPLQVTSNSMFPTAAAGDWVVISPRALPVARGDIVLFKFPYGGSGRAIKRVVAIAGDRVAVDGNEVRINPAEAMEGVAVIPEGYYFILGDNTASSVDSRTLGLLSRDNILGTVAAIVRKPW